MSQTGFYAPRKNSPGSLALVVLLHAGLIGAVVLIKSPEFIRTINRPLVVDSFPIPPDPPQDQPPPPPHRDPIRQTIDHVRPVQPTPTDDTQPLDTSDHPTVLATNEGTGDRVLPPPPPPPPPLPVRHAAEMDPRFAADLQPPYPPSEQRLGREGSVRVRVTIGPNGRVIAVARLSATSDAFWQVTERQALSRWRFRPATLDGRPVEDSKVLTLTFRLLDNG